jgi:transcriptional regulator with XRE-family HTH domain
MRQIRERRGLSLRDLERPTFTSKSTLHKIETGVSRPTPETVRLIDDALEAGGELMAMVHPHQPGAGVATAGDAGQRPARPLEATEAARRKLDRRHVLAGGAFVAGMAVNPDMADLLANEPHEMHRALDGGASEETLRYLEASADRMMLDFERAGPVALLGPVLEHFRAIRRCVEQPQTVSGRRRLTRLGAELGTLLGLFAYDDEVRSRSWFAAARRAAIEAGDDELLAKAIVDESVLDYFSGRAPVALEAALAAGRLLRDGGGVIAAMVAARTARAYAAIGDQRALRALDDAAGHLEQAPADPRETYLFGDAQLAYYRETCHLLLGGREAAEQAATRALELYQRYPNWMDPALVRLELAVGRLTDSAPDIEAAAAVAREALESLPFYHRTGPVRQRTAEIVETMCQHPNVPAAREFVDFVAQS